MKKYIASESDGIKAIKYLQKVVGITETDESARKIWNGFSDGDKQKTMQAYSIMSGDVNVLFKRNIVPDDPESNSHAKKQRKHSRPVPVSKSKS